MVLGRRGIREEGGCTGFYMVPFSIFELASEPREIDILMISKPV